MKNFLMQLIRPRNYLNILLFFLLGIFFFVFGITFFCVALFSVAFVSLFALAIFLYPFADLDIGSYKIDSFGKALICTIIGLFLLSLLIYLVNKLTEFAKNHLSVKIGKFYFGNK